jgi:hypothetical protein
MKEEEEAGSSALACVPRQSTNTPPQTQWKEWKAAIEGLVGYTTWYGESRREKNKAESSPSVCPTPIDPLQALGANQTIQSTSEPCHLDRFRPHPPHEMWCGRVSPLSSSSNAKIVVEPPRSFICCIVITRTHLHTGAHHLYAAEDDHGNGAVTQRLQRPVPPAGPIGSLQPGLPCACSPAGAQGPER